jgi:hypothetical protein
MVAGKAAPSETGSAKVALKRMNLLKLSLSLDAQPSQPEMAASAE